MSSRLKGIIQYLLIFLVTILLLWYSLKGLALDDIALEWRAAHKGWLAFMAILAIVSHWLRAVRWRMLLQPTGHYPKASHGFLALMIGYFVNVFIPRGGEISRCFYLFKLDKVPVEIAIGTVVTERLVDLICLAMLVFLSFALESQKLFEFVSSLPIDSSKIPLLIGIGVGILMVIGLLIFFLTRIRKVREYVVGLWTGVRKGLVSIFYLKSKTPFILYSILIWALYFFMSYSVMQAFPATAKLGFAAVLSLFAIGAIAMAAPLPAGTGSYHLLVPQGLIFLYNIPAAEAKAFTVIFHGWQTLVMIAGGAICLSLTHIILKKNKQVKPSDPTVV